MRIQAFRYFSLSQSGSLHVFRIKCLCKIVERGHEIKGISSVCRSHVRSHNLFYSVTVCPEILSIRIFVYLGRDSERRGCHFFRQAVVLELGQPRQDVRKSEHISLRYFFETAPMQENCKTVRRPVFGIFKNGYRYWLVDVCEAGEAKSHPPRFARSELSHEDGAVIGNLNAVATDDVDNSFDPRITLQDDSQAHWPCEFLGVADYGN